MSLAVVVPLPVDTTTQTSLSKDLFVDLVLAAQGDLRFEGIDLLGKLSRNFVGKLLFPEFGGWPSSNCSRIGVKPPCGLIICDPNSLPIQQI